MHLYTDILQCEMFPLSLRNHLELRTMILLPFEEFEAGVQDIADSRSPELRMGQFIYNLLYMSFPEQVELPGK